MPLIFVYSVYWEEYECLLSVSPCSGGSDLMTAI